MISRSVPVVAAVYAVVGGALSLAGWITGTPRLLDWLGVGIAIKANTSIAFILAGTALFIHLLIPRLRLAACVLGLVVAGIGAATLFQHLSGANLGIDTLFFVEPAGAASTTAPGRMGMPASTSLTLLGTALFLIAFNGTARRVASVLATLALAIASLSLVGYLFGANQLYSIASYTGVAFQTASMLAALAMGIVWAVPEYGVAAALGRDDTGGLVFRRMIVPAILISLILGWLRVWGQNAGMYDLEFGTAARTIAEILLLLMLLWLTTGDISRAEAETRLLSRLPAENPNPVMRLASNGDLLYANDPASALGIDWTAGGNDTVAKRLREFAAGALAGNEKINTEIDAGKRVYACTFAPIAESGYVNVYASDITDLKLSQQQLARHVQEMAALYRFTDRLNRSSHLEEVFEPALEAITDALGCDRASILLFNDGGVLEFVAWRGLSDEYRAAVSGHSPWSAGTRDAAPFGITDIDTADLDGELKAAVKKENIRALAFIPLVSNGVLIGKFMAYCDDVHVFTDAELEVAMTVAHQIAFGVERRRSDERRRETEAALRENDTRLRLATRTGKVGVWDWDIQANRVSWSESLYAMHGVDENGFDGTVEGFARFLHPADADRVRAALAAALAGDAPYELEFRVVRPGGEVVWLDTNATVLRDGDEPVRMIGATMDITSRKLAELERGKLAAIVESSNDAVIGKDLTSTITSWNRAAEQLFGYSADEAIGQSILMLIPPERHNEEAVILNRIGRGEKIEHFDTVRRRKDGRLVDISLSISPIIDAKGKVIGASKIARDITLQKAVELERGRLGAIVDSSNDAVISKDLNSTITSWNRAAEDLFGYTADEAVGRSITMLIPEDRLNEESVIIGRIGRGEKIEHYETVRRRKNGSLVDISLSISPIMDAKGTVIGASKIARDITQRKAAEEALRKSETMHTLINAQESERHRIARDLHDHLGQQITALRLRLESIRSKAAGGGDDSDAFVRELDETCAQASRIDSEINFLSWELRPTELDNLGLRDALSSFVREWSVNYGIEAEFHSIGDRTGRLHPDIETNLYRIAQEGLNNILKHSNANKVSVLFENRDGDAVLIIEDDGVGFEPKPAEGRARNGKGGLGLLGMRERTSLLGGTLEIETFPGKGTSLFARVPVRAPESGT